MSRTENLAHRAALIGGSEPDSIEVAAYEQVRLWSDLDAKQYAMDALVMGEFAGFKTLRVFDDSQPRRLLVGIICYRLEEGGYIEIHRLGTDRGRGYGRALVTAVAEAALDAALPIVLTPSPDAIAFYEHLGFVEKPGPTPHVEMILTLEAARRLAGGA